MTNYSKFRGDTVQLSLAFTDGTGAVINITGYTVFFTMKRNKYDTDAQATFKKDITSHTNAVAGLTVISLTTSETALFQGSFYYDIQYKTSAGVIGTSQNGVITFAEDTTIRTS